MKDDANLTIPYSLSISIIYGLAKKTTLLRSDPILWFSMMLMPAGPPALVIQGLAELAKASETQKMTIAKTLTVCTFLCLPEWWMVENRGHANG